jgi:hypothetical protein
MYSQQLLLPCEIPERIDSVQISKKTSGFGKRILVVETMEGNRAAYENDKIEPQLKEWDI